MAKTRKPRYRVKPEYLGKIRLESGRGTHLLDKTTPQTVLEKHYATALGKGFIELVTTASAVVAQPNDNGTEAGQ